MWVNGLLRDVDRAGPHPFAATVTMLRDGLAKLRAIEAPLAAVAPEAPRLRLWRGMRNVRAPELLMRCGGTELAPASFTPDLQVAAGFASSRAPLLFVINTDASFMQRGVAMQWLSTAPFELEYLLPPCTYLEPTGRQQVIELRAGVADGVQGQERCTVVEVVPQM